LYDAMATMDTITLICSAIRGLLRAVGAELAGQLRSLLAGGDAYANRAAAAAPLGDSAGVLSQFAEGCRGTCAARKVRPDAIRCRF
jgi:hypothetical protein